MIKKKPKHPGGRPPKKKSQLRSALVTLAVTPKERELLNQKAQAKGQTFSNWARCQLGLQEENYR